MKICFRLFYDSQADLYCVKKHRPFETDRITVTFQIIKSNLQFCQLLHRMSHERFFKMRKMFTLIPNIFIGHSEILTFLTAPFGFFQMHNYQIHYELSKQIWPRQASSGHFGTTNCTQMAVVLQATAPLVILYL